MSDCLSCLNFKKNNCPHPGSAKDGMFVFLDILLILNSQLIFYKYPSNIKLLSLCAINF